MREMDEVAKCMWFLADTGWTCTDDDLHVRFHGPGEYIAVVADEGFNPYIYHGCKPLQVEDLFTAVVVAYVASHDPTILKRVKWTNNEDLARGAVAGRSVTMEGPQLPVTAWGLVDTLNEIASETALIVRLDVRETHGGFVWTIYWQEPGDGEA